MAVITWDEPKNKVYETGIDRGVLYLTDGFGVAWNGLISMDEESEMSAEAIYFDGFKVTNFVTLGHFAGTLTAYTYPYEFMTYEGMGELRHGVMIADQPLKTFSLSYRTLIGNEIDGSSAGYKLHIIYNLTAIPSSKSYATMTDDPEAIEFEWDLTSVPVEVRGFRQTSHLTIDSRNADTALLKEIEDLLYGTDTSEPSLLPIDDLVDYIDGWFRLRIIDHGDGTWSAVEKIDGNYITMVSSDEFVINNANAIYLDPDTYNISSVINEIDSS